MKNEVKEAAPKYNFISPEEYLALERASEEKHEYYLRLYSGDERSKTCA
jgi:hypothetical protein